MRKHIHNNCCDIDPCKEKEPERFINATQLLPYLDVDDISSFDIQKSLWRFYIKTHNTDFLTIADDDCDMDYVLLRLCGINYIIPHNSDGILIKDKQEIILLVSLFVMHEYHMFMLFKTKDRSHELMYNKYLLDFNRELARICSNSAGRTLGKAIKRFHI